MRKIKAKRSRDAFSFLFTITVLILGIRTVIVENKSYMESKKILEQAGMEIKEQFGSSGIEDAVGYLYIPKTTMNYPVMQSGIHNPDFYLNHNPYKEYSIYGTPYLSAYCDINQSDNCIIYGHNISGRKLFGELIKYKDKDFYIEHKYIYFQTEYTNTYEIIGVIRVNKYEFPYYQFVKAENEKDYNDFVKQVRKNSIYECRASAQYGRQLLTLSTCDDYGKDNRFAVIGVKISNHHE